MWFIGVGLTVWAFFMLIACSGELGNIGSSTSEKVPNPFAPISTQAMDTDAGLVLLDIQTEQVAAFLYVSGPGVYVLAISRRSPASRADIHPGDCILQLNDEPVTDATELLSFLNGLGNGEAATILLRRGLDQLTILYKAGSLDAQI